MSTFNSCETEFKYCPICQLPLQAINIYPTMHATHCLSSWDGSGLKGYIVEPGCMLLFNNEGIDEILLLECTANKWFVLFNNDCEFTVHPVNLERKDYECPDGAKCLSTNIFHYRDYCHTELAKYRSSSAYVEPEMAIIPSPKKRAKPSPMKQGRPSPKKHGRPTPLKRPKMLPAKSTTVTTTHKTKPISISESNPYYSSDSDSDFILPRKRPSKFLEYSDSDSSVCNSNKNKRTSNTSRTAKSVSDAKNLKKDIPDGSKSVDSQETFLQKSTVTSDSSKVKGLLTEINLMFSDVSDLFSDDETFLSTDSKVSLKETKSEISTHLLDPQYSGITNKISETIGYKSESVSSDTNKNVEGLSYKESKSEWKTLLRRMRDGKVPSDLKVDTDDSSYSTSASSEIGYKQCPFYRRIPGTPFVVDAFQYGEIPGATVYFLSHFHSDHYIGLRKSFSHPIYCSQITANLVRMKLRVEERWLNILTEHEAQVICGVEVTALDANHCPGSQMYLFRLKNGCNYLHVGDFRASTTMCSYPELKHITISKLFLDTTYCSKQYVFPTQEDIISKVVSLVRNQVAKHPQLLVVCGSYLIGKEKVFLGIAEALDWKVWVRSDKRRVFECLNDSRINSRLTAQGYDAKVHVLPMNHINHKSLKEHAAQFKVFTHVIGIKPTGWELNAKSDEFKAVTRDNCTVYGVAYSEHSSYSELRSFVQYIRPEQIIPTVNVGNPASRNKMAKCFQEWMCQSGGSSQSSVSRYFNSAK